MLDQGCDSLDSILCDPSLAEEFDTIAARWAPGSTPLQYRWAALKLRKDSKDIRSRAQLLADASFRRPLPLDRPNLRRFPDSPGVYVVLGGEQQALYAGEANNLRDRLSTQFGKEARDYWKEWSGSLSARYFPTSCPYSTQLAYQRRLVIRHQPIWNLPDRKIA
jgi:hypothetical protein